MGVTNGSGVFVAGERPLWLVASRGTLLPHLMEVDGAVTDMTPFHNINCPQVWRLIVYRLVVPLIRAVACMGTMTEFTCAVQGFITACVTGDGEALKICQMPMRMHLDSPWPMQKIPLRATPLRIAYYAEARLYVVLTSRPVCFVIGACMRSPLLKNSAWTFT